VTFEVGIPANGLPFISKGAFFPKTPPPEFIKISFFICEVLLTAPPDLISTFIILPVFLLWTRTSEYLPLPIPGLLINIVRYTFCYLLLWCFGVCVPRLLFFLF
jgi:hypothetical protein